MHTREQQRDALQPHWLRVLTVHARCSKPFVKIHLLKLLAGPVHILLVDQRHLLRMWDAVLPPRSSAVNHRARHLRREWHGGILRCGPLVLQQSKCRVGHVIISCHAVSHTPLHTVFPSRFAGGAVVLAVRPACEPCAAACVVVEGMMPMGRVGNRRNSEGYP